MSVKSDNMAVGSVAAAKLFEAGEKLSSMCAEFQEGLEECIAQNEHRREPYWILFHASWKADNTQLHNVFSPRDTKPPKMLATMCFKINNRKGTCKTEWILPPDAPTQVTPKEPVCEVIAEGAMDMPIIY